MHSVSRKREKATTKKYDGPVLLDTSKYGDMLADPELWEQNWNADLKSRWQGPRSRWGSPLTNIADRVTPEQAKLYISDTNLLTMHGVLSQVCRYQNSLGIAVARRALISDYEHDWRTLPDSRRRMIVLQGICRAMRTETFIPGRSYCPDSTLENLTSARGEKYLKYLRQILPDDVGIEMTEPKTIPHPIVDRYLTIRPSREGTPGYKALAQAHQAIRIQCFTSIIGEIFETFCGRPYQERGVIKGPRGATATIRQFQPFVDGLTNAHVKNVQKQLAERKKTWHSMCWYCHKSSTTLPGIKLSACSRCREVGRTVFYCSRECQVADWKKGIPVPHKQFCGQLLDEDTLDHVEKPAQNDDWMKPFDEDLADFNLGEEEMTEVKKQLADMLFPEPSPGYKRSIALQLQIKALRENFDAHYMIFEGLADGSSFGVRCREERFHEFLEARSGAFSCGDPAAIRRLYILVCTFSGPCGVPYTTVRRQMEREYGISLDDVPVDKIKHTKEEILEGQKWLDENVNTQALVPHKKAK